MMGAEASMQKYTAIIQQTDNWWIGWVEEIPGDNSQGKTRQELMDNHRSALAEMIEYNREEARAAVEGEFIEESIAL
jgi:predicted RNase H-like HicB family nuclease